MEDTKIYEFRTLKATDIFLFTKLLKKIGLTSFGDVTMSDDFQTAINVFTNGKKEKREQQELAVGKMIFTFVDVVLERLDECENEIFTILSKTSNLSRKEVENLDLNIFIEMIYDFVKKEEFGVFFKRATALLE